MQDTTATLPARQEFGIRLGAWFIDILSVGVLSNIAQQVLVSPGDMLALAAEAQNHLLVSNTIELYELLLKELWYLGLANLIIVTVFYACEVITGQSVGKLALGLRVGTLDGTPAGQSIMLNRALFRHSGLLIGYFGFTLGNFWLTMIGALITLAVGIGCFFVLGDGRQALHDRLTRTAVFKKKQMLPAGTIATPLSY